MVRAAPTLTDVQHSKLCYSKDRYCGHPRQCGIYNFGNGEIVGHASPRAVHLPDPHRYQARLGRYWLQASLPDRAPAFARPRPDLAERQ